MEINTLFEVNKSLNRPLASKMRPDSIDSFRGQEHLLGEGKQLRRMLETGKVLSSIFFGPPGCGKTALANIFAVNLNARIEKINAVNSSVSEIRDILNRARQYVREEKSTILIIDEIHRFNRNQQEALLPDVEEGNVVLIGITTENPYYFVSGPLLSRAGVYKFNPLSDIELKNIIENTLSNSSKWLNSGSIQVTEEALNMIIQASEGDARYALNILEMASITVIESNGKIKIDKNVINSSIGEKKILYDKSGDQHYDTVSAFIKSLRGSDPDAAVFYLAKMLAAGDDPRFIARRMAIAASEDIGNADPQALILANTALNAVEYVGMPEARIILGQVAVYIACSPKSNASYMAINKAMEFVANDNNNSQIPVHLTKAGKRNYKYPHNYEYGYIEQKYMNMDERFYVPSNRGHEKFIKKYLDFIRKL